MQLGSPPVSKTIETLIQGWPEAALVKNQHGNVPLNCAFMNMAWKSSLGVIMLLVQSSVDTLTFLARKLTIEYLVMKFCDDLQLSHNGMLPIYCACHAEHHA